MHLQEVLLVAFRMESIKSIIASVPVLFMAQRVFIVLSICLLFTLETAECLRKRQRKNEI